MFKHTLALVGTSLSVIILSVITLSANAALFYRGNGMIYDDTRDITWLRDANYAKTSGHDPDGKMNWTEAIAWAAGLSYEGYNDWRLPSAGDDPDYGYGIAIGELGAMFYNNLSNTAGQDPINVSFTDAAHGGVTKSFLNVQSDTYWYSQEHSYDTYAWTFLTSNGYQDWLHKGNDYYSWAVRTGDVPPVPVPEAAWLFAAALLGLAGVMRRRC